MRSSRLKSDSWLARSLGSIQFFVGQAGPLAAEHQRCVCRIALARECLGRAPGIEVGTGQRPRSRAQAGDPMAAGQRSGQVGMHTGLFEDIIGASGHGRGLRVGKLRRCDQMQLAEPHGFHRPGGGTDVARMGGRHQHDARRTTHGADAGSPASERA